MYEATYENQIRLIGLCVPSSVRDAESKKKPILLDVKHRFSIEMTRRIDEIKKRAQSK